MLQNIFGDRASDQDVRRQVLQNAEELIENDMEAKFIRESKLGKSIKSEEVEMACESRQKDFGRGLSHHDSPRDTFKSPREKGSKEVAQQRAQTNSPRDKAERRAPTNSPRDKAVALASGPTIIIPETPEAGDRSSSKSPRPMMQDMKANKNNSTLTVIKVSNTNKSINI